MHIQKSAAINTNNPTHHYLHPGTGWTKAEATNIVKYKMTIKNQMRLAVLA